MNLQRGQGRNQTWTTQALLECVDGLLGEASALFLKNSKRIRHHQYRPVSLTTSRVRKVSQMSVMQRKLALSLPTSISLALQRTGFWNHQPRTKLLDSLFSDMHVKEQGLVKLRSKFALQGFHSSVSAAIQSELSQSGSCGDTATLFRSHLAISHLFGSIEPGGAGLRLVVDDPFC